MTQITVPLFDCPPLRTEVKDMNEVRRTFRQIDKCMKGVTVTTTTPTAGDGDAFQVHEHAGGQAITETASTMEMDTETYNTDTAKYTWDAVNNVLTIADTGPYEFGFRVTLGDAESANTIGAKIWLEKYNDGTSEWDEVDGTRAYLHTRGD